MNIYLRRGGLKLKWKEDEEEEKVFSFSISEARPYCLGVRRPYLPPPSDLVCYRLTAKWALYLHHVRKPPPLRRMDGGGWAPVPPSVRPAPYTRHDDKRLGGSNAKKTHKHTKIPTPIAVRVTRRERSCILKRRRRWP